MVLIFCLSHTHYYRLSTVFTSFYGDFTNQNAGLPTVLEKSVLSLKKNHWNWITEILPSVLMHF